MQKWIKHSLFAVLMLLLILPFLQQQFEVPKVRALKGAFSTPPMPGWSFAHFWDGSFQDSMNKYLENNIGYRPDLVRLHNQLQYSLFDTINAQGVIIGKAGYLFELNYIKALYGLDYVGDEKVKTDVEKTIVVNNWLKANNKQLIVVLAPGKGSFFPEFIPDKYRPDSIGKQNYTEYYRLLLENNIDVIGGNDWFNAVKDTSRYALYPKAGIHWSYYGLGMVFDSVFKLMEHHLNSDFIDFEMAEIKVKSKLRSPDRDLWEGMNIILPPADYPMPYPEFTFNINNQTKWPRVITVADSYYWQWFGGGYAAKSFKANSFWYYNKQVHYLDGKPKDRVAVDLFQAVADNEVILIIQTDANMDRYGFGFIDELYALIKDGGSAALERKMAIKEIADRISKSDSYMEVIHEKAKKRGISAEEMLLLDAGWVYDNKQKKENSQ
ncbi:MAG: hypothetical protein KJ578_08885 [Bacteroidetes bacterium]|nr:hypothetical protein [Bacteroidota bacterium]MBU1580350.1 hypothetical protein [Bacteroidota bacterium]MBU2557875.1 hypothetical protein [Bacteroidota bacterium]